MKTYNAPEERYEKEKGRGLAAAFPLAKVFLYFAAGLLVTGGVGWGWPYFLLALSNNNADVLVTAYTISVIISLIAILPLALVIGIKAFRPKTALMTVCYFLYAVALGIFISSVFLYLDAGEITLAFLITGGAMLVMGVIGTVFKRIGMLVPFLMTALLGVIMISLINSFFFNETIYWVVDFVFFAIILLITAVDINRIKSMASGGWLEGDNNLAVYAAYTLLTDFIMIFIRVATYLSLTRSR